MEYGAKRESEEPRLARAQPVIFNSPFESFMGFSIIKMQPDRYIGSGFWLQRYWGFGLCALLLDLCVSHVGMKVLSTLNG